MVLFFIFELKNDVKRDDVFCWIKQLNEITQEYYVWDNSWIICVWFDNIKLLFCDLILVG